MAKELDIVVGALAVELFEAARRTVARQRASDATTQQRSRTIDGAVRRSLIEAWRTAKLTLTDLAFRG